MSTADMTPPEVTHNTVPRKRFPVIRLVLVFLCITLAAWPIFVACNLLLNIWAGEGTMLDTYQLEPRRLVAIDFLVGLKHTLPIAAALGVLSVLDYTVVARLLKFRKGVGLVLLMGGAAGVIWLSKGYPSALVPIVISAVILALKYRVLLRLLRLTPYPR